MLGWRRGLAPNASYRSTGRAELWGAGWLRAGKQHLAGGGRAAALRDANTDIYESSGPIAGANTEADIDAENADTSRRTQTTMSMLAPRPTAIDTASPNRCAERDTEAETDTNIGTEAAAGRRGLAASYRPRATAHPLLAAQLLAAHCQPPTRCTTGRELVASLYGQPTTDRLRARAGCWPNTTGSPPPGRLLLATYVWPPTVASPRLAGHYWPANTAAHDWPPTTLLFTQTLGCHSRHPEAAKLGLHSRVFQLCLGGGPQTTTYARAAHNHLSVPSAPPRATRRLGESVVWGSKPRKSQ